jgi:hypothetical protein
MKPLSQVALRQGFLISAPCWTRTNNLLIKSRAFWEWRRSRKVFVGNRLRANQLAHNNTQITRFGIDCKGFCTAKESAGYLEICTEPNTRPAEVCQSSPSNGT